MAALADGPQPEPVSKASWARRGREMSHNCGQSKLVAVTRNRPVNWANCRRRYRGGWVVRVRNVEVGGSSPLTSTRCQNYIVCAVRTRSSVSGRSATLIALFGSLGVGRLLLAL